jgi:hypothetical protein
MPTRCTEACILVVAPNPQIKKLLKSILTVDGYNAYFATEVV